MSESTRALSIGEAYSRQEIHGILGGSTQTYLPVKDGRVTCICLTRERNRDTPYRILVGASPKVVENAEILVKQGEALPLFFKERDTVWTYMGRFKVQSDSLDAELIERHRREVGRKDEVTRVITLVEAS